MAIIATWTTNSDAFKLAMVATNTSASSKYYTDLSECTIDSNYYRPRLKMLSSVTQRMPFFYEDSYPVNQISFQIYMDSTDRTFWLAKEMIQGDIKLYIGASEADQLSEMTCIFIGRVPLNGISAVRDIVNVTAIDWLEQWETIYPMSTKSVYYQNVIKGNIKVEKEEASIPIIFGDYRKTNGAWDISKVVTTEYNRTGTDDINLPVKYYELGNSEYQDLFGSMPDMFGQLEFTNVGVVDISVYGDTATADKTAGYLWTGDYGDPRWQLCPFESIERRSEGENQKFTDGYNIEVGMFHQPGWHWYENNTYDILTVGNPEGWDYLYSLESKESMKRFWFLWHDTDDDCLYVSSMDGDGDMTWDGINLYTTGGSNWKRSVHEHEDDGGTEITVSDSTTHLHIWKKSFCYRAIEDGVTHYEVGTFMERNDSGTVDIDLIAYYSGDNSECESIVNKQTNTTADLGNITWADGCPRMFTVNGALDNHSAVAIGDDGAYIYNISDAGGVLWFISEDTDSTMYDYSNIGCCCYHMVDDGALYEYEDSMQAYRHNYEHNVARLKNAVCVYYDTDHYEVWLHTIQWDTDHYEWVTIAASNADELTSCTTPQVAGYIISDQKPSTGYDKFYYVFLNDENDSGQSYLYVRDLVSGAEGMREIPLNFHWIYDVAVISRSTENVTVLVATHDGIYAANAEELFFSSDAIAKYNDGDNDNDSAVADAFQLVSKNVVNCLTTAAKYVQYQYPWAEYVGSQFSRNPYENLWAYWGCSLSRDDDGLHVDWQGGDSEANEIRFTTQANSLDQLGWYGDCNINSTEMTNWEYIPMYLLWRAEGNTSFEVGTTHIPNTVDSTSWNTAKALRDNYFTGNIRVNIKNKDRVVNHVWRLVKQMGHRMYTKYSGGSYPQLSLDFAFDKKTSSKTLDEFDLKNVNVKYYEGYISTLRGQWNKVRDNAYSWAEVSLSDMYGGVKELDFPLDIYVEYDGGVYTALGGNSAWQTFFDFLLAHESGFDAHDDSEDRPRRVVTCYVSPEHWSTALTTCITIDSTDYPEATGDYILYSKTMDCSNMSQQWVLLEQSDLDYDGSEYAP